MARSRSTSDPLDPAAGLGFLLSQVGSHSSSRFADRLEPLGLKPPHAGILRVIEQADGLSQQALGEKLGIFPSRLVALIDELEGSGLLERRNSPADRRAYKLCLTGLGLEILKRIRIVSREHQASLCAALSEAERAQLAEFLKRIATEQALTPGVHPGFRKLSGDPKGETR